jgi:hypothetical protein
LLLPSAVCAAAAAASAPSVAAASVSLARRAAACSLTAALLTRPRASAPGVSQARAAAITGLCRSFSSTCTQPTGRSTPPCRCCSRTVQSNSANFLVSRRVGSAGHGLSHPHRPHWFVL